MLSTTNCQPLTKFIGAILIVMPTAGCTLKNHKTIDDVVYTAPSRLVEVEPGRRLNIYCVGYGKPVVVFDSGLGDSTKAWGLVQPEISKQTQTCSYDRAGLGFSDPAKESGTSRNAVRDLKSLLQHANIQPPYVLVGHSYGGMNVKLFAETFPSEVAGLVLVEPSHEDVGKELFVLDPESLERNIQYLNDLKRCLAAEPSQLTVNSDLFKLCVGQPGPRYSAEINTAELALAVQPPRISAWISEMTHVWRESADQVRASYRSLGGMPIVVLTKPPSPRLPSETAALREQKNAILSRQYDQIAGMSSNGRRISVEDSGHYIQHDQPSSVISAIRTVIHDAGSLSAGTP
jgi:pimeloyl-ACP methyl ester carboxylesterase